ncbi:glycosyltransferase family 39 protein [Nocardia sp. NPDC051030]|uniref:glycosyltransferase family 39 protein n=1 Tax=Nocardia sp. NPDC051030 TaxID=3155162 RepID=UPI003443D587
MYWVAGIFAVVLTACSNRYGYHRDELYFLAAGRRLDWGYADQPPLVPLLARVTSAIDSDSLVVLRIPAIVAAVLVVVCAGWMARELGGGRAAQTLSAGAVASAALLLGAGHLFGTTIFDLAVWSGVTVLVLRLLRPDADSRWWLLLGVLAGIGMQNKALAALPLLVLAVSIAVLGPREVFATRYFPLAIGIAALLVSPYLWWQANNDWPQWTLSRAIAGGSSGTSNSPLSFVLLQFGLMGPVLVPLWIFGLWCLWRRPRVRAFVLAYGLLFTVYLCTGGKAYYLGGMYPLLLAAGAVGLEPKLIGSRMRGAAMASVVAVNAAVSAVLFLPILPVSELPGSPVLAINYDAGETIGWPEFVRQIAEIRSRRAPDADILTANYGEAGAIERFGPRYGLPVPHSPHNSYWWWGPPDGSHQVIIVGVSRERVSHVCADPDLLGGIDNGLGLDNDEQGKPVVLCRAPLTPWPELWSKLRQLG